MSILQTNKGLKNINNISIKVETLFKGCLFTQKEIKDIKAREVPINAIIVEAVMLKVGFHQDRLESAKPAIREILLEMPDEFRDGWSFLNLCHDKNGNQWTGLHNIMDMLVALGLASNIMKFPMPRKDWTHFPGGMPYIVIDVD